jgi:hypothetical protein
MARVLGPGGTLLIANLTSFNTACGEMGWVKDAGGRRLYYPIDNYLQERAMWIEYRGIRVINHHRPLSMYLRALLGAGLVSDPFRRARTHGRRTGFSRAWLCACALVPGHGVAEAPILR